MPLACRPQLQPRLKVTSHHYIEWIIQNNSNLTFNIDSVVLSLTWVGAGSTLIPLTAGMEYYQSY